MCSPSCTSAFNQRTSISFPDRSLSAAAACCSIGGSPSHSLWGVAIPGMVSCGKLPKLTLYGKATQPHDNALFSCTYTVFPLGSYFFNATFFFFGGGGGIQEGELFFQRHLFNSDKMKSRSSRCKTKPFRSTNEAYVMNSPGSFLREGLIFWCRCREGELFKEIRYHVRLSFGHHSFCQRTIRSSVIALPSLTRCFLLGRGRFWLWSGRHVQILILKLTVGCRMISNFSCHHLPEPTGCQRCGQHRSVREKG